MKLYFLRAWSNYFRVTIVAAKSKDEAKEKGEHFFGVKCSVSEVKIPGYKIYLESTENNLFERVGK